MADEFFVQHVGDQDTVMRDDGDDVDFDTIICVISVQAPEGTAEQIARSLNRLPKAEALLIEVAQAIRAGGDAQEQADLIEEFVVNG